MKISHRSSLLLIFVSLLMSGVIAQQKSDARNSVAEATPAYRNPKLAIDDRVADLLSRMTLEEKVSQIAPNRDREVKIIDPMGTFTDQTARQILARWWDQNLEFTPRKAATLRNGIQRYLREKTRLGIPQLFMGEALHGFMEYGSTSFSQAIGLAGTFDPALVKQVFTTAGDEAGATGTGQVFSPLLDLARDPRWGRTEETYGEGPYLVSQMAVAAVTGLQGDEFLIGRHHVVATMKHFAAHGQPEGGTIPRRQISPSASFAKFWCLSKLRSNRVA